MLNSLITPVSTIFIMLGEKCNCNCRYCLQHVTTGLVEEMPQDINPDIYILIRELANQRKDKAPLTLHFFGGEPLVYLSSLKEVIKNTEDISNIRYSMMSNGKLFNKETVEYINKHHINVGISWDGNASSYTRNYNVMEDNIENILNINDLWLSAVLSKYALPRDILDNFKEIQSKRDKPIGINIDEIFDTGVPDKDLFDIDLNKVSEQIDDLCKQYMEQLKTNTIDLSNIDIVYIDQLIGYVRSWYKNPKPITRVRCGAGVTVLNMDLQGNFYNCHNSSLIVGNIYQPYQDVLDKLNELDTTSYYYNKECKDCSAISICRGGCKLVEDKRRKALCDIKKAIAIPILNNILKLEKINV